MPQVQLPPGNRSLLMEDGHRYRAEREGGYVTVSDEHARAIDRVPGNGDAGLLKAGFRQFGAVKKAGRWCRQCNRLWYPWSDPCPRCNAPTELEQS